MSCISRMLVPGDEETFRPFREVFLGEELGVGLFNEGPNDLHVQFVVLCRHDRLGAPSIWREAEVGGSSASIPELAAVVGEVYDWLVEHADPDVSMADAQTPYGWRFREGR